MKLKGECNCKQRDGIGLIHRRDCKWAKRMLKKKKEKLRK